MNTLAPELLLPQDQWMLERRNSTRRRLQEIKAA
jgi:hypothetical protein